MLISEIIAVALSAIRANKLRSFLTSLGIIIGVSAVIAMVALGTGAQAAVEEQIQNLGADILSVYSGQHFSRGVASANRVALTTDDADALRRNPTYIREVVPELSQSQQVTYGNENINVSIIGTTPNYPAVHQYEIIAGRMFTEGDDESRKRVAVLGWGVPEQLGTNGFAMIGQTVRIRGISFEVIGLFAEKGSSGNPWENPDERLYIPLRTAQFRVFGTDRLRSLSVQTVGEEYANQALIEIETILRREHKIQPGAANDFRLRNRSDILSTLGETTKTFTFLLAGIAAVSLAVGGIGIMNIMLVSVTERTREIGTRKALGATRSNILSQFLIEALVLCLIGGAFGILAGAGGAYAMARFAGWNTMVSPAAVGLAFAFSAGVGLFFGIWPARRAARLDPIEALRYE